MSQRFGVVILAAGVSARSRRPKQLLPYLGKTLVEHAARTAVASGAHEVVVVVGSDSCAVREKLKGLPVRIVHNRDWQDGKSSSIRSGVAALTTDISCAVIALCDQSRITPELLRGLARRHFETGASIVASSYDGVVGAPSAFGVDQFENLMSLQGDIGAKELIRHSPIPIETIEFSGGNVGVDVPSSFWRLIPRHTTETPRNEYKQTQHTRGPPLARSHSLSLA